MQASVPGCFILFSAFMILYAFMILSKRPC